MVSTSTLAWLLPGHSPVWPMSSTALYPSVPQQCSWAGVGTIIKRVTARTQDAKLSSRRGRRLTLYSAQDPCSSVLWVCPSATCGSLCVSLGLLRCGQHGCWAGHLCLAMWLSCCVKHPFKALPSPRVLTCTNSSGGRTLSLASLMSLHPVASLVDGKTWL